MVGSQAPSMFPFFESATVASSPSSAPMDPLWPQIYHEISIRLIAPTFDKPCKFYFINHNFPKDQPCFPVDPVKIDIIQNLPETE